MARRRRRYKSSIIPITLLIFITVATFKSDLGYLWNKYLTPIVYNGYVLKEIPTKGKENFIVLNDNEPYFDLNDYDLSKSFEKYSPLDGLGRCRSAVALLGKDLMPTEERGSIGMIKPSGWQTVKYDFVDGKYLYNRCHLIGYQLSGENANDKNLITCTRSMNTGTMLDYENKIAKYIKETGHHVLYRVTPAFHDDELLARGVEMEAKSIEDDKIKFNIFVFNVEDGIEIDYKTGDSSLKK